MVAVKAQDETSRRQKEIRRQTWNEMEGRRKIKRSIWFMRASKQASNVAPNIASIVQTGCWKKIKLREEGPE